MENISIVLSGGFGGMSLGPWILVAASAFFLRNVERVFILQELEQLFISNLGNMVLYH